MAILERVHESQSTFDSDNYPGDVNEGPKLTIQSDNVDIKLMMERFIHENRVISPGELAQAGGFYEYPSYDDLDPDDDSLFDPGKYKDLTDIDEDIDKGKNARRKVSDGIVKILKKDKEKVKKTEVSDDDSNTSS